MVEQFFQEKRYLQNVSPATIELYKHSFQAFAGAMDTLENVKVRIVELRMKGMSPSTVNTYVRHIKTFFLWQGKPFKLPALKEEQKILATFSAEQISRLIHWKPVRGSEVRLKTLSLTLLDTGMRIDELLSLTREQVNLDNLCILVKGKGNKQRLVPMSIELRKLLYRHLAGHKYGLAFCTKHGSKLSDRTRWTILRSCANGSGLAVYAAPSTRFATRLRRTGFGRVGAFFCCLVVLGIAISKLLRLLTKLRD